MELGLDQFETAWNQLSQWRPQKTTFYAMLAVTLLSTVLIVRRVGNVAMVTGATGFIIMYICAYIGNFLGRDLVFASFGPFQKGIALSFTAQIIGAIIMLMIFKVKDGSIRRY
jgi:uncharacterized membrane protein YeaQ/YmgE (transglycosylase-associated protein family)